MNRRNFLTGAGAAVATGIGGAFVADWNEWGQRASVFIARAAGYQADLERTIALGLTELGLGRAVGPTQDGALEAEPGRAEPRAPEINTHPAWFARRPRCFGAWGASSVFVAEGPGHCRDASLVLDESGLGEVLDQSHLEFVDLNHDDVEFVPNRLRQTTLPRLALPASLKRADLIVSMPKLKTHHWVGVTLSLKNLFGMMPGIVYGWPKNVLHYAGIGPSILDIAAAVRPHLAIVDGIIGMEGDGPIMGVPRRLGVLVMGTNLPAVDATCARLMQIDPARVGYLAAASGRLGPIAERHIRQRGEMIAATITTVSVAGPAVAGGFTWVKHAAQTRARHFAAFLTALKNGPSSKAERAMRALRRRVAGRFDVAMP